ncbi:MAG: hypothetical protein ACREBY_11720 [Polaromonas sp.]
MANERQTNPVRRLRLPADDATATPGSPVRPMADAPIFMKPRWIKRMFLISKEQADFLAKEVEGRKTISAVVRLALDELIASRRKQL